MTNIPSKFDHLFKILIIGESGVGKTCFLLRYAENSFVANHLLTIGIDFKIKMLELDGKLIKLQIWDTAGQDRFRTIRKTYYKGSQGVILVYDVCDEKSFGNVKNWVNQIEQNAKSTICKVLVGNKCDKPERVITEEQGKKLAEEYNMKFFETSAKTAYNIKESSEYLINTIIETNKKIMEEKKNKKLIRQKQKEKSKCCK